MKHVMSALLVITTTTGASAAQVPIYDGSPVFRAEIVGISGEGIQHCDSLEDSIQEADRLMAKIQKRTVELNGLLEKKPADRRVGPRIGRLIGELDQLRKRFDETYPAKQAFPTVTVHFSATIPTLWPKKYDSAVGRMTDSIQVEELLLPDAETTEEGPFHSVPKSVSGGNNHFTGPQATLEFSFTRRFSLRELCIEQPLLTLSVKRRVHPYYNERDVRIEEKAVIEASYSRLKKAVREVMTQMRHASSQEPLNKQGEIE